MERRNRKIVRKKITREDIIEKEKSEDEAKRLRFIQKVNEANVAMAIELNNDLNKKNKHEKNLKEIVNKALNITNETHEVLVKLSNIKK